MTEILYEIGIIGVSSFILTAVLSRFIIPILRQKKIGQSIREEGPAWHMSKAGTPTMGGICFIMAMLIALAGMTVWYAFENRQSELIPLALTMALAVMNGMVGFVDDYCKLIKHQNEGLKPLPKFILQTVAAIAYVILLVELGYINTVLHIPFTEIYIELSAVYYIFAVILIVGVVNSVNFTDGVDGLASGVTLVVALFFAIVSLRFLDSSLALVSGGLVGAMCGFLIYNRNPAKVFMGDTGSLFLGGAVCGAAFIINEPMIIFIVGGVYIMETVSIILQVFWFKTFHKRIFKMAPIHHHFEKCGWKENKVVTVFSLTTALLCVIAWFGL